MGNTFFKKNKVYEPEISKEFLDELSPQNGNFFSGDFKQDINHIKRLYSFPTNIDFMVREFSVHMMGKKAVLFYIPSLTDAKLIDEEVIKPLIITDKVIQDVPSSISVSDIREEN